MRFRLGSEVREGRYWVVEERKVCRLCGGEMERWERMWEEYGNWKEGRELWQEAV